MEKNQEMEKARKTNSFKIVGTIKETKELECKTSKAGEEYLSGTVTLEVNVPGEETSLFEVEVYQKKLTKDGKPSQLFDTYLSLVGKVGQKYVVNGSITENRFFDKKTSTLASAYKLSGKWFNPAKIGENDEASFEFSGFVNKVLTERTAKKDNALICYDIEIGQASYNDDKCSIYKFQVDPNNISVVSGIQSAWAIGSTVKFFGKLSCVVEQQTVEEKSGFGETKVKTYVNTKKRFWITGGDMPITNGNQYSLADVQNLKQVYAKKDLELNSAAQSNVSAGTVTAGVGGISSRTSSLI